MKNFKKIIASVILIGSMSLATGCNGASSNDSLDVNDMKTKLNDSKVLTQKPMETPAKEHWMFEDVKDKVEDGFVSQAMINVHLQDVVVVKTTDTDAVVKSIENYKENSLKLFAGGYGGDDNATAVADSKLEVVGDVVYFIATPNVEEVEKAMLAE